MTTVQQREAANLLGALGPVVDEFVQAAARSKGDFHCVEEAGSAMIQKVRTLIMSTGLAFRRRARSATSTVQTARYLCTSGKGVSAASRHVRAPPLPVMQGAGLDTEAAETAEPE